MATLRGDALMLVLAKAQVDYSIPAGVMRDLYELADEGKDALGWLAFIVRDVLVAGGNFRYTPGFIFLSKVDAPADDPWFGVRITHIDRYGQDDQGTYVILKPDFAGVVTTHRVLQDPATIASWIEAADVEPPDELGQ